MTESNVKALTKRFGGVEYLRIRDTKAYLLVNSPANAVVRDEKEDKSMIILPT